MKEIIIEVSREFDASSDDVFNAWLDREHVGQWLFSTPDGTMKQVEMDPVVGGGFLISELRGDQLTKHIGRYIEIEKPTKILFSFIYEAEQASPPTLINIDILPKDNGCVLTLSHALDNQYREMEQQAMDSWNIILDGLEKNL